MLKEQALQTLNAVNNPGIGAQSYQYNDRNQIKPSYEKPLLRL